MGMRAPGWKTYHAIVMKGNALRTFNYCTTHNKGTDGNWQKMIEAYERRYSEPWDGDIKIMEVRRV